MRDYKAIAQRIVESTEQERPVVVCGTPIVDVYDTLCCIVGNGVAVRCVPASGEIYLDDVLTARFVW